MRIFKSELFGIKLPLKKYTFILYIVVWMATFPWIEIEMDSAVPLISYLVVHNCMYCTKITISMFKRLLFVLHVAFKMSVINDLQKCPFLYLLNFLQVSNSTEVPYYGTIVEICKKKC